MHARLAAGQGAVAAALTVVRAFVERAGLDRDAAERLAIIVEEWVANVAEHGEPPAASRIGLRLACGESLIRITMTDAGRIFDPRTAAFGGPNVDRAAAPAWS